MKTLNISGNLFDKDMDKFRVMGVSGDVSLYSGYKTEDDGILYGLQGGTLIKSNYSKEDIAHSNRMSEYEPIDNGEVVLIEGNQYITRIIGNYSTCVMFDLVD
jgi:hypothetical protein